MTHPIRPVPLRVEEVGRVTGYVRERIDTAPEPNRVALHVSPNARIVVAVEIVMQPVFRVEILPRRIRRH
jgi:hypothetical protein